MNQNTLPVYMIVKLDVKNFEDYMARYGMPVLAQLEEYGAEVLAASPQPQVVEGIWESNWTVIIRFPSMESAHTFYNSDEYAPFMSLRIDVLTNDGTALFVEVFNPESLGG